MLSLLKKRSVLNVTMLSICLLGGVLLADGVSAQDQETGAILQRVAILANEGNYTEFRDVLEKAVNDGNTNKDIVINLAYVYNKIFLEYDKAETLLIEVIEEQPEEWPLYQSLGQTNLYQKEPEKAIANFTRVLELYQRPDIIWDRTMAGIYFDLARAYVQAGETGQAIQALEKSLEQDPFYLRASNLLHQLYVRVGQYEKAHQVWKANNQVFPGQQNPAGFQEMDARYREGFAKSDGNFHFEMGKIYRELLLYDEAERELSKALTAEPDNKDIQGLLHEVNLFLEFRDKLQAFFADFYRLRYLNGVEEERGIYSRLVPIYEVIAPLFPAGFRLFDKSWIESLNERIQEKFSAIINIYQANGALVCSFGPVVSRHQEEVVLGDNKNTFTIVILKNMVSNGRMDWVSDRETGIGGWSSDDNLDEIVLIADFSYSVSTAMNLYNDMVEEIAEGQDRYDSLLNRKPKELYFDRLIAHKFFVKEINKARAVYEDEGISLQEVFKKISLRYLALHYETSLFHEAQHALDGKSGHHYSKAELEFRAKLAELIYGNEQYITLSNLYNPSVASANTMSHAQAERWFFRDLVEYISSHGEKFPEIDLTKNILAQLPDLSKEQFRQLARDIMLAEYPEG